MSVPLPSADLSQPGAGDALGEWGQMDVTAPRVHVSDPSTLTTTEAAASESDPPAVPRSDTELLAAFVQRRDADAFTEIVQRYRHLVYRVALRTVVDRHLADDVFQATFLVLAQSAKKIKRSEALAAWLHGTARNIARRAMVNQHAEQKQLKEWAKQTLAQKGEEMATSIDDDPFEELTRRHEQQLLDEELQQLSEASRAPLVLFYLEKKSQAEIAQIMGLSVEAVEGRLKRAKQELRTRLIRRGVLLSTVVAAATVLTPSITSAAPAASLVSATVTTALGTAALGSTALGATAVTGAATSSQLAAGSATATTLAAQEIALMSATSKATAMLITTAASTTLISGLVLGAMVGTFSMGAGGSSPPDELPLAELAIPQEINDEAWGPNLLSTDGDELIQIALVEPEKTKESEKPASVQAEKVDENLNELRTVAYEVRGLSADDLKDANEYAQSIGLTVDLHLTSQTFVVRGTSENHRKLNDHLSEIRQKYDAKASVQFELFSARSKLAKLLKKFDENHPDVKQARNEIAAIEKSIAEGTNKSRIVEEIEELLDSPLATTVPESGVEPAESPKPDSPQEPGEFETRLYTIADMDADQQIVIAKALQLRPFVSVYRDEVTDTLFITAPTEELAKIHKQYFQHQMQREVAKRMFLLASRTRDELSQKRARLGDNDPEVMRLQRNLVLIEEKARALLDEQTREQSLAANDRKVHSKKETNSDANSKTIYPAFGDVVEINELETTIHLPPPFIAELRFPEHITAVDSFDDKRSSVQPISPQTLRVKLLTPDQDQFQATGKSGKKFRVYVRSQTPKEPTSQLNVKLNIKLNLMTLQLGQERFLVGSNFMLGDLSSVVTDRPDVVQVVDRTTLRAVQAGKANIILTDVTGKTANIEVEVPRQYIRSLSLLRQLTPVEQTIYEALCRQEPLEFPKQTLSQFAESLSAKYQIPVKVDWQALETAGVAKSATVSFSGLKRIEHALTDILSDVGGQRLNFDVDNGELHFTSQEAMKTTIRTRKYDLSPLTDELWIRARERLDALQISAAVQDRTVQFDDPLAVHKKFEQFLAMEAVTVNVGDVQNTNSGPVSIGSEQKTKEPVKPAVDAALNQGSNDLRAVVYPLVGIDAEKLQDVVTFAESLPGSVSLDTTTHSLVVNDTSENHHKFADYLSQLKVQQQTLKEHQEAEVKLQFELVAARKLLGENIKEHGRGHPSVFKAQYHVESLEWAIFKHKSGIESSEEIEVMATIFEADDEAIQLVAEKTPDGLIPKSDAELKIGSVKENIVCVGQQGGRCQVGQTTNFTPIEVIPFETPSKDWIWKGISRENVEFGSIGQFTVFDKKTSDGHRVLKYDIELSDKYFGNVAKYDGRELPAISGRLFRGYATIPDQDSNGILIGPLGTVEKTTKVGTLRKVSTYILLKAGGYPLQSN